MSGNLFNDPRILLERRMRVDLIKTFKIINEISNCGRHFSIFLLDQLINGTFLLMELYIFGRNCLIRSKRSISEEKRLNWMVSLKKL